MPLFSISICFLLVWWLKVTALETFLNDSAAAEHKEPVNHVFDGDRNRTIVVAIDDRVFRLNLRKTLFNEDALVDPSDYVGTVDDDPDGHVQGRFDFDGVFDGYFQWQGDIYYLEPSSRPFDNGTGSGKAILNTPTDVYICFLKTIGNGTNEEVHHYDCQTSAQKRHSGDVSESATKTAAMARKRKIPPRTCPLKIVVDYRLYRRVDGNTTHLVHMIQSVIKFVDEKFRNLAMFNPNMSDFAFDAFNASINPSREAENIGFWVKKLDIWTVPIHETYGDNASARWDYDKFFREMYAYNFEGFCAGLLFTYRPMDPDSEVNVEIPSMFYSHLQKRPGHGKDVVAGMCIATPNGKLDSDEIPTFEKKVNYGIFVGNALPVNFLTKDRRSTSVYGDDTSVHYTHVQTMHQLGVIMNAYSATKMVRHQKEVYYCNVEEHFTDFPLPSKESNRTYQIGLCTHDRVKRMIDERSACLEPCDHLPPQSCYDDVTSVTPDVLPSAKISTDLAAIAEPAEMSTSTSATTTVKILTTHPSSSIMATNGSTSTAELKPTPSLPPRKGCFQDSDDEDNYENDDDMDDSSGNLRLHRCLIVAYTFVILMIIH